MWTAETRVEHDRDDLRYPSDLTDAEWQILAPLLPPPAETGRHRCWPMREVMNAIFFVPSLCCAAVVRGACCRSISRRTRRPTAGLPGSATTERGKPSTTTW